MDLVNILARIPDSEQNLNGSADPMITADRGFIQFWGPDFGFWLLGSSSLLFFLVSARFSFDTDVGYINISLIAILNSQTQYQARQLQQLKSLCISRIIQRGKQFADSDLVDFLSGSTDSAIKFSGSADLHTPFHSPPSRQLLGALILLRTVLHSCKFLSILLACCKVSI